MEESTDCTFVASAISPTQKDLIEKLPLDKPVYVEGGFFTWLRSKSLVYFVLRADKTDAFKTYQETKDKEENYAGRSFIQRKLLIFYFMIIFKFFTLFSNFTSL